MCHLPKRADTKTLTGSGCQMVKQTNDGEPIHTGCSAFGGDDRKSMYLDAKEKRQKQHKSRRNEPPKAWTNEKERNVSH